jgi:hypothetical protein
MLICGEGEEGVLHERSKASDEKGVSNGYSDFSLYRVPGFIVNGTRILTLSYNDFASAGFSICKNGLLQNKKSLPELNHVLHQTFVKKKKTPITHLCIGVVNFTHAENNHPFCA